jgi:hypothetical protein
MMLVIKELINIAIIISEMDRRIPENTIEKLREGLSGSPFDKKTHHHPTGYSSISNLRMIALPKRDAI